MDSAMVNVGGEELELRPINARQYLSARMEAELMYEAFGEDQVSKSVLMGASLLAKGLYLDNQRVFSSMEDVLDAMSAEEIVLAAGFIDLEPNMKTKIVETMDRVDAAAGRNDITSEAESKTYASGADKSVLGKEQDGSLAANSDAKMRTSGFYSESSISPRSDMRYVSDFFQRDSRRYDGTIVGY